MRMLIMNLWAAFVEKERRRPGTSMQLALVIASTWVAGQDEILELPFVIKDKAIKGVMDKIRTHMEERRRFQRRTGAGVDSGAVERAAHDEAQAKTWRMTSDAMRDLARKAKEVLSHTGATTKTAPVTSG